jgi:membrane associated rhomboid family serine protease
MLFPIGDDQLKGGYKPMVSYSLIALNVLCFFAQNTDPSGLLYVPDLGSVPQEISHGVDLYTLITSMFMHGGFMHLLGNMLFLWVFGDNIEAAVGNLKFALFYVMGGLVASAAQIAIAPESPVPCVGASGAIAAVMGAYLVMYPKSRVKMLFVITFSRFYIPAIAFLGMWIVQQVMSGMGALPMFSNPGSDAGGVAYWAHIGGFVAGLVAGFLFRPAAQRAQALEVAQVPVWQRFA